jgi:ATP-binding cassette subfamily C protein
MPLFDMTRRGARRQLKHMRGLATDLQGGVQALKAFKAMRREQQLLANLTKTNLSYTEAQWIDARARFYLTKSQELILVSGIAIAVYIGHNVLGMGAAETCFFAVLLFRISTQTSDLLTKFQFVSGKCYALHKYFVLRDAISRHGETRKESRVPECWSPIIFSGVSFRYQSRQILSNVSLMISARGMTAIVGPSGAGKTTMVDLLCGLYLPDAGSITIGGHDLQTLDVRQWRRMIGYVGQEPNLINDTIRANVAAFDASVSDEDIWTALRLAGASAFVAHLERGLDTNVGEAGAQISGGERQRISIARALARRPKLLVLDEPTASLDRQTEAELIDALQALKREIPIFAISHQAAIAEAADEVYSLQHGLLTLQKKNETSAFGSTRAASRA